MIPKIVLFWKLAFRLWIMGSLSACPFFWKGTNIKLNFKAHWYGATVDGNWKLIEVLSLSYCVRCYHFSRLAFHTHSVWLFRPTSTAMYYHFCIQVFYTAYHDMAASELKMEKHPLAKRHETFVSGFCLTRRLRPYPFFGRTSQNKKTNKGESWIIYKPRRIEKRVQYIHIWEEKPRPTFPDLDAASSSLFIFSFLFMANWVTLAGFVLQQRPFVIITPPLSVIYLQSCSDDGSNNLAFFPQVVFSWK